jgi:hypothetical protein
MAFDVKKWLADQTAALGLEDTERAAAEKLLTNPKFQQDFVPTPVFHSTVDRVKNQFQSQLDEVLDYNNQWQEKYETEFKPALDAVARLRQAGADMSGYRNDGAGGVKDQSGNRLSADEVQELINQSLEPVRAVGIDYATFITEKGVEYSTTYKKPFKASEFRKFAYENREQFPTLQSAFDAYTADDRKAQEEKDKEDWKTAERERIRLELQSSQGLPEAGYGGDTGSPLFIANEQKEDVSRDAARQAFAKQFANVDFSKVTS